MHPTVAADRLARPRTVLPVARWTALAEEHAARADALTEGRRRRRAAGETHAIDDFLYDYYGTTPARLRRWHPGAGVALEPGDDGPPPHAAWRWYATYALDAPDALGTAAATDAATGVVGLDLDAWRADRGSTLGYVHGLLTATAARVPFTGCLGLHEWAMVYRQPDAEHRHALPLRLGREGTDAVVDAHPVRCTHFDAFRFFTPDAVPRNRLQPTRETQVDLEQPGCLHANMDLLKWALKLGPVVDGALLLDCFELARDIRTLDMQASPYDVSSLGEPAVAIETPEGKAEYAARQRGFAERSAALRARLVAVCEAALP